MGNNILAIGLAHAPALTNAAAEMLIPCVLASFFSNVGMDIPITQIANVSPNCDTIGNIISDVGANVVTEIQAKLERVSSVFLACDKGNKKNDSFFVKILCWWDHAGKKVDKFVLDVDGAEGLSQDVATSIDQSLQKVDNQFVESGVKNAKFCATNYRNEMLTSYYTLLRSISVSKSIQDAITEQNNNNNPLKGNWYMTSGLRGSQKRKNGKDEVDEIDINKKERISGKRQNCKILTTAKEIISRKHLESKNEKSWIQNMMLNKNSSEVAQQSLRMDKFEEKRKKRIKRPRKPNNKIQEGPQTFEIAPALLGQVNINDMANNKWIPKICLKLQARGVAYDVKWGLKKLREAIITHEYANNVPDNDANKLFFPKWRSFQDWGCPKSRMSDYGNALANIVSQQQQQNIKTKMVGSINKGMSNERQP